MEVNCTKKEENMAILTKEQLKEKILINTLNTCEYISGYKNIQSLLTLKCLVHNIEFQTSYDSIARSSRKHHVCPKCKEDDSIKKYESFRIPYLCDFCGKEFSCLKSKVGTNKSNMIFCSRRCKEQAQRKDSGPKFNSIRPEHYNSIADSQYRKRAFKEYLHECASCGWDEDDFILEVHHKDSNHDNNEIGNLMILCPICHRKITSCRYEFKGNKIIKKEY